MKNLGIYYGGSSIILEGYSDASWITSVNDNKFIIRWIFTLGSGIVSWASKKQIVIIRSIIESKFITLAVTEKKVKWLRNMLLDIALWPQPMQAILIYCDSETTISIAHNKIYNRKSRHISLWLAYVRELMISEVLIIIYARSCKNLTDPLTKVLSRDAIVSTSSEMGLKPFN